MVGFAEPVGRERGGRRPALVVSSDELNAGPGGVVLVVPLTTTRRGLPSHVEIEPGRSGLRETSYAKVEDVKSVSVERLAGHVGAVSPEVTFAVSRVLRFLLAPLTDQDGVRQRRR